MLSWLLTNQALHPPSSSACLWLFPLRFRPHSLSVHYHPLRSRNLLWSCEACSDHTQSICPVDQHSLRSDTAEQPAYQAGISFQWSLFLLLSLSSISCVWHYRSRLVDKAGTGFGIPVRAGPRRRSGCELLFRFQAVESCQTSLRWR